MGVQSRCFFWSLGTTLQPLPCLPVPVVWSLGLVSQQECSVICLGNDEGRAGVSKGPLQAKLLSFQSEPLPPGLSCDQLTWHSLSAFFLLCSQLPDTEASLEWRASVFWVPASCINPGILKIYPSRSQTWAASGNNTSTEALLYVDIGQYWQMLPGTELALKHGAGHCFKVYISAALSTFTLLCDRHHLSLMENWSWVEFFCLHETFI